MSEDKPKTIVKKMAEEKEAREKAEKEKVEIICINDNQLIKKYQGAKGEILRVRDYNLEKYNKNPFQVRQLGIWIEAIKEQIVFEHKNYQEEDAAHVASVPSESDDTENVVKEDIRTCFIDLGDGKIAEQVLDTETKESQFAVYDKNTKKTKYQKSVKYKGIKYYPRDTDVIKKEVVLFPSKAQDYESEIKLIEEIKTFIHKYLDVSKTEYEILPYRVLFSWVYDKFSALDYTRALGESQSGKSRLLDVIGCISYRPIFISGALTEAVLFRMIEKYQGTLVINEADIKYSDTYNYIIKILNEGYEKRGAVVRLEHDGKEWVEFAHRVYGPKILATRRRFEDEATESRCYTIQMEITEREDIPYNLDDGFYKEAEELRNKLLLFRFKNYWKELRPISLKGMKIEPRLRQTFSSLLSIITSNEVRIKLEESIKLRQKKLVEMRQQSIEYEILMMSMELIKETGKARVKEITAKLNESLTPKFAFTPQFVGKRIRDVLGLETERDRPGMFLKNSDKLKARFKKYGIEMGQDRL